MEKNGGGNVRSINFQVISIKRIIEDELQLGLDE